MQFRRPRIAKLARLRSPRALLAAAFALTATVAACTGKVDSNATGTEGANGGGNASGNGIAGGNGSAKGAGANAGGSSAGGASGLSGAGGSADAGSQAGSSGGGLSGSLATDPGNTGDGDVIVGPSYTKQPELTNKGAPVGKSFQFRMSSTQSQIYTGLDTTLNAPKSFERWVSVYIPAKYKDGTPAPFLIIHDGPGPFDKVRLALDNLAGATDPLHRLPAFIAIAVASGGGDSLGSQRGLEYDTMSDRFARFVDTEVLPAVLANAQIRAAYPGLSFTKDPEGRGALGCSSGGAAALSMGWFRPDLFRRLITYSGTFVDQQDTDAAEEKMYPLGAWEYHSGLSLIANSPVKPLRIVLNVNQNDLGATAPESGHHNWVIANQRTAAALKAKGYHYRYIYGLNAGHCDSNVEDATLADSLIWVWRGYP